MHCSKRGRTFKLQQFASLYFLFGQEVISLAFTINLNQIYSVSICSGQDIIKYHI